MRKYLSLIVIAAAMTAVAVPFGAPPADAQTRKEKESPKAATAGTVEVHKAKDGYRFRVKNADGKTVAMSPVGYDTKDEALKALEFVKATLDKAKPVEVKD
jgi:uncharacterized protein YegP (UPF0339 family)